jgi:hypothetical protein
VKQIRPTMFLSMALSFGVGMLSILIISRAVPALAQSSGGNRLLAFTANRDGKAQIYLMNPDGSNQVNVSRNQFNDAQPAWSPDGQRIAFESDRDGNNEICVMNADGSNQHCLTSNKTIDGRYDKSKPEDHAPSWSPDSSLIAFYSDRNGNPEIYVMNADGSNMHNTSNHPAGDYFPAWQPVPGGAPINVTVENPVSGTEVIQPQFCPTNTPIKRPTRPAPTRTPIPPIQVRPTLTPGTTPQIAITLPPPPQISSRTPTPHVIKLPSLVAVKSNTPQPTTVIK